jgi:hypothetical protein
MGSPALISEIKTKKVKTKSIESTLLDKELPTSIPAREEVAIADRPEGLVETATETSTALASKPGGGSLTKAHASTCGEALST